MDELITGCQYCIKHRVRGVLITTCFLKLKLRDLYQNFMEDLIHSPGFLGENILDSHCSYAGLGRMTSQKLIFSKWRLILTANPFSLTDLKLSVSIRASFREVITVKQIPLCREVSNTWLSQHCQDMGLIPFSRTVMELPSHALALCSFCLFHSHNEHISSRVLLCKVIPQQWFGFFFPRSFICFCLGKLRKQKG